MGAFGSEIRLSNTECMKILVIDDHILFREGLKYLLAESLASVFVVEAGNCEEALLITEGVSFELILLDYNLPGESGIKALGNIMEHFPQARVVMLSGMDDPQVIRNIIGLGASGFIPKTSTPDIMIAALRLVLKGGIYLPPQALSDLQTSNASETIRAYALPLQGISSRQLEVLMMAVEGKANKAIAKHLNLSEGTVKAHLSSAFKSLGVQNRTEAAAMLSKLGQQ